MQVLILVFDITIRCSEFSCSIQSQRSIARLTFNFSDISDIKMVGICDRMPLGYAPMLRCVARPLFRYFQHDHAFSSYISVDWNAMSLVINLNCWSQENEKQFTVVFNEASVVSRVVAISCAKIYDCLGQSLIRRSKTLAKTLIVHWVSRFLNAH